MIRTQKQPITLSSLLKYIGLSVIIGLFGAYVIFQARYIIRGPELALTNEPNTVQNEQQITLTGTAENITNITLNGRTIVTDQDGHFREHIVLENGYNIVSIEAHDRYGRSTILEREFVYTPLSYLEPVRNLNTEI